MPAGDLIDSVAVKTLTERAAKRQLVHELVAKRIENVRFNDVKGKRCEGCKHRRLSHLFQIIHYGMVFREKETLVKK